MGADSQPGKRKGEILMHEKSVLLALDNLPTDSLSTDGFRLLSKGQSPHQQRQQHRQVVVAGREE